MDRIQYDVLHSSLIKQDKKLTEIIDSLDILIKSISKLEEKTLVVSDVDKELKEIKQSVEELKDEVTA